MFGLILVEFVLNVIVSKVCHTNQKAFVFLKLLAICMKESML